MSGREQDQFSELSGHSVPKTGIQRLAHIDECKVPGCNLLIYEDTDEDTDCEDEDTDNRDEDFDIASMTDPANTRTRRVLPFCCRLRSCDQRRPRQPSNPQPPRRTFQRGTDLHFGGCTYQRSTDLHLGDRITTAPQPGHSGWVEGTGDVVRLGEQLHDNLGIEDPVPAPKPPAPGIDSPIPGNIRPHTPSP